jgi:hypothetical protein
MSEIKIPEELAKKISYRRKYVPRTKPRNESDEMHDAQMTNLYNKEIWFLHPRIVECLKERLGAVEHKNYWEDVFELPDGDEIGVMMTDYDGYKIVSEREGREDFLKKVLKDLEACEQATRTNYTMALTSKDPKKGLPLEVAHKVATYATNGGRRKKTRKGKKSRKMRKTRGRK